MKAAAALDTAKRLHGAIGRLAERRERQVQKATGEFQLDLLAAINDTPDEILDMIMRAVQHDPGQAYLQLALSIAIDERNDRRGLQRSIRFDSRLDRSEAETESPPAFEMTGDEAARTMRGMPPPRFEVEGELGALDDLPESAYPPGAVDLEPRYPEPGEPATVLPDGTVVALLDAGTLDATA